ncbi:cytochrome c, nitrite reductase associated NirC [Cupriavidus necator N-1]|uniref:Cytochrome c, nitrite reductase associated NirC n=1 Tax=Cupriavidus necator (strain ATCC 43291 / DSM 13513 / CCUG 52238 / LMG 8453 / N-1) TaxID=1042878 RepID=F8GTE9_CUPNN|nr:cytochrome c [Cupriavidus necator]AEI81195.1 cytochrome c, nitrite reductase associated NirC [Cupriavidus necator N-1]MDX6009186.1 cytochrome c [Cupriavidus necator]
MRDHIAWRRAALAGLAAALLGAAPGAAAQPTPARQAQLAHWLRDDCGACHGMTLRGGLGPPLTREALSGKPPAGLIATVLYGRPGTAMPPWQPFMTQDEAQWLIDRLQAGKPAAASPQGN